jgi:hypothetical protein
VVLQARIGDGFGIGIEEDGEMDLGTERREECVVVCDIGCRIQCSTYLLTC